LSKLFVSEIVLAKRGFNDKPGAVTTIQQGRSNQFLPELA
jgi:hypothetical protein